MGLLSTVNWREVFLPGAPLVETFVRGTVVYLALVVLLRVVLKREAGALSVTDVLVVVLLGDASQNAMASDHKSIAEGMALVCTILFWNYCLDWLGYRFPAFERLLNPPALCLVRGGKILRRNMRREMITEEELMSQVRAQGMERLDQVKDAFMESDGRITVIGRSGEHAKPPEKRKV